MTRVVVHGRYIVGVVIYALLFSPGVAGLCVAYAMFGCFRVWNFTSISSYTQMVFGHESFGGVEAPMELYRAKRFMRLRVQRFGRLWVVGGGLRAEGWEVVGGGLWAQG